MLKWFNSWLYTFKLKCCFRIVKEEMFCMAMDGNPIPENYLWKRIEELLKKEKEDGTSKTV